jgi:hypothetical protein
MAITGSMFLACRAASAGAVNAAMSAASLARRSFARS